MFTFNKRYFLLFTGLLVIEVLIALFIHDRFIRSYIGDLLIVILLYCGVKSFFRWSVGVTITGVWLFALLTEWLQYQHIVWRLGLEHSTLARIIIGTSFEWTDLLAYTMGAALVLLIEKRARG